jgi:hypothetical protein
MTTIYTVNNKVLKNSANDKWLIKKAGPAGFVMNGSNATYTEDAQGYSQIYVAWEGPAYPSGYNGNGKQYILVNNNATGNNHQLMYSTGTATGGPDMISTNDMGVLGTSNGVLLNNVAGGAFGTYIVWPFTLMTLEQVQAYMANVSITIVDP